MRGELVQHSKAAGAGLVGYPKARAAALTQELSTVSGSGRTTGSVTARARRPSMTMSPASAATIQSRISSSTSSALRSRVPGRPIPSTWHPSAATAGRSTPDDVSSLPEPTHSASLRARTAVHPNAASARSAETTAGDGGITPANTTRAPQPGYRRARRTDGQHANAPTRLAADVATLLRWPACCQTVQIADRRVLSAVRAPAGWNTHNARFRMIGSARAGDGQCPPRAADRTMELRMDIRSPAWVAPPPGCSAPGPGR